MNFAPRLSTCSLAAGRTSVAVIAAVLLLMPLVVLEASPTAGATGLLIGLLAGAALARR